MTRRQNDPLRALTGEERQWLEQLSRAQHEPAAHVMRATELLAVAGGHTSTQAAQMAGRQSGAAVSQLVTCVNQHGLAAPLTGPGGGPAPKYTAQSCCLMVIRGLTRGGGGDIIVGVDML